MHHQLHYVYARRFLEAAGVSGANARYLTERMILEEACYLNTFDSAVVLSEVDQQALMEFCPGLDVTASPCPSPEEPLSAAPPFEKVTKRFVFVGTQSHYPNVDGLCWFMKDVWPTIKSRLPGASIEVTGKWSQSGQTSVPNYEDIRFAGFVAELAKSLQDKVMIVPVRIGSGIRTKILLAWGACCPAVTTSVGVEGLPGKAGEHFVIADDALAFSDACIKLSQDVNRLNRIAANALELVQKHYSLAAVRKTRLGVYEKLLATRGLSGS